MDSFANWLGRHWTMVVPLVLGAVALWRLLPRMAHGRRMAGGLIGAAALLTAGFLLLPPSGAWVHDLLFYIFSVVAVTCGVLMITNRNPVYSALWFALVTLAVCGLFLLRSAAFLAAATVIVYAGAIIVTFLFVIMLAQQAGMATYDYRAAQPLAATLTAFVLLGGLLYTLQEWGTPPAPENRRVATRRAEPQETRPTFLAPTEPRTANLLSQPADDAAFGTMRGLGRSLFGDYVFAVELAGTLLLVAAIGAIAIAPRRSRGTL